MANPKEDIKKTVDPSFEEIKKQATAYEDIKKKTTSYEEPKKESDPYEELKKQFTPSYPEEIPYSTQLRTLREKVSMLASNPNSDVNEIAQCIKAITFFENQQARELAEMRKEAQKSSVFFDSQSILQTGSVRKKDPRALDIVGKDSDLRKTT